MALSISSLITTDYVVAYGNDSNNLEDKYVDIEESGTGKIYQVVDIQIDDSQTVRVGVTGSINSSNYSNIDTKAESSVQASSDDLDIESLLSHANQVKEEQKAAEYARMAASNKKYSTTRDQGGLLDIENPDSSYTGTVVEITGEDRDILERLVMGEAGGEGFEGAALVAQCIRDMYLLGGFDSVESVRVNCGYSGSLKNEPNQDSLDAVAYIFDQGGYAVKHRILYFYAPKLSKGIFHETQNHIITYKNHKVFDRNY